VLTSYTPDLPPAPAVTVIIPAFRCQGVIGDALDAALQQTFTDREILVVNDGCPDTKELESILAHYRNHILYMRRPQGGPGAARNTAMSYARGRYLAFLDADDIWAPDLLQRLVPVLERDRNVDVVYCDATLEGDAYDGRRFMQVFPSHGAVTLERMLEGRCNVLTSGALVRAGRVREIGPFDESLDLAEDYDLWIRLLLDGARFSYVRETLVRARLLPTRLCADPERAERAVLRVLGKLGGRRDLTEAQTVALAAARERIGRSLDRQSRGHNALRRWIRSRGEPVRQVRNAS
jgi:glycosyltransferase involved in cell wall biosynthesis